MSRLRLLAGPNGSGKSSIFQLIREFKEKQKVIPTGPFVNSDLIEKEFSGNGFLDLRNFGIDSPPASLIEDYLKVSTFKEPYDPKIITAHVILENGGLKLNAGTPSPLIGMIVSDLIRARACNFAGHRRQRFRKIYQRLPGKDPAPPRCRRTTRQASRGICPTHKRCEFSGTRIRKTGPG